MPYCGRYGCGCCTCEDCGTYNGCICEVKKETELFIDEHREHRFEETPLGKAIEILEEWLYR